MVIRQTVSLVEVDSIKADWEPEQFPEGLVRLEGVQLVEGTELSILVYFMDGRFRPYMAFTRPGGGSSVTEEVKLDCVDFEAIRDVPGTFAVPLDELVRLRISAICDAVADVMMAHARDVLLRYDPVDDVVVVEVWFAGREFSGELLPENFSDYLVVESL